MRFALAAALLSAVAFGQWIKYPTPGVPRGKDGKPNLSAPAPRAADGKPDLSGIWVIAQALPCPASLTDDAGECLEKMPISQAAADLSKLVPGGLPLQPWSIEVIRQRKAGGLDPHVECLPSNFPRMFTLPHFTKFVQTPGLLMLANEFNASYRQIFTDGRPLPVDPQPSWNGYSTGKWEGDTLVVETNGFRDDVWLDIDGSPLTESGKMTERMKRLNYGTLQTDVTIEDPKTYTKPFTVRVTHHLLPDTDLIEFICTENDRSGPHLVGK